MTKLIVAKGIHPIWETLNAIADILEASGVTLDVSPTGALYVTDGNGITWRMVDIERDQGVTEFPPSTEYRLTRVK